MLCGCPEGGHCSLADKEQGLSQRNALVGGAVTIETTDGNGSGGSVWRRQWVGEDLVHHPLP